MAAPRRTAADRDARVLSLLRALVRINTEHAVPAAGAPYGEGCARALDLALGECARLGLSVTRLGEKLGWAEVGSAGPLAAFPVHLDVVPAGEGWTHDPYAAEVADGVLYGRGCMDNKIAAAIMTVLLGELAGRDLPCRLRLIFGTDEETGMSDLREYVEAGCEQPSLGFVPDASFPVVRGEKARLHLVVRRAGMPEGLSAHGGVAANTVPAEACATLPDGAVLEERGTSVHGSMPERGVSAVRKLMTRLSERFPDGPLAEAARLLCGDLTGEALGISLEDDVFGGTSVNVGTLDIEGGTLAAELDVRLGLALGTDEAARRVGDALGPAWSVEVLQEKPAHLVGEDDPCVRVLLDAYERVTGEPGGCSVMAGGTYASLLPALVAFGPKLPGTHSGGHGADEHVRLADIVRATDIYHEALLGIVRLAASQEG